MIFYEDEKKNCRHICDNAFKKFCKFFIFSSPFIILQDSTKCIPRVSFYDYNEYCAEFLDEEDENSVYYKANPFRNK